MATRSLTEAFMLMRNNALQSKHFFDQSNDDRTLLVTKDETDIELGNFNYQNGFLPTQWQGQIDEIKLEFSNVKAKMGRLSEAHDRHLTRPTMDEQSPDEALIDKLTTEITYDLHRIQGQVRKFQGIERISSSDKEALLGKNVLATVARELQETSVTFRTSQSQYLNKVRGREEWQQQYFELEAPANSEPTPLMMSWATQQQRVEDVSEAVESRERQIAQVVRSIQDINDIFSDLAILIVDQGSLLDRIDFNLETTSSRVEAGVEQLQKAHKIQRRNRKMHCIVLLFIVVVLLLIILIASKS